MDLVKIQEDCTVQYFAGKLAIIVRQMGMDSMDVVGGFYYELCLAGTSDHHIFNHSELELLSKGKRNA